MRRFGSWRSRLRSGGWSRVSLGVLLGCRAASRAEPAPTHEPSPSPEARSERIDPLHARGTAAAIDRAAVGVIVLVEVVEPRPQPGER